MTLKKMDALLPLCAQKRCAKVSFVMLPEGMQRREWFELHDHSLFPAFLRNFITDALQAVWDETNVYRVVVPRLHSALKISGATSVVDLCSGAGGPWMRLQADLPEIPVHLTDKYPNAVSIARTKIVAGIDYVPSPVDAMNIPQSLAGFRTMFSSFHHFGPADARSILADAVKQRQGIAICEAARRSSRTMLATAFVPLIAWYVTPRIRPFRWSRLFWTYLVPIVPLVLLVDGILSCLRTYSTDDMRELAASLNAENYRWEIGEEHGGRMIITYLIGYPA